MSQRRFLIIQTAFIGDVVLATPLAQVLKEQFPDSEVHFLVRKGNENLLLNHQYIDKVFTWKKNEGKYRQLFKVIQQVRTHRYDEVFNLQRFFSSGLITLFTKAKIKSGFDKNPLAFTFTNKVAHRIPQVKDGHTFHEVERNLSLLQNPPSHPLRPRLYPAEADYETVKERVGDKPYFVVAPASVWFTKQWPLEKWQELLNRLPISHRVFIVGAPDEAAFASKLEPAHPKIQNLCGQLSMLQTVALMEDATRVFTNDSAPLHFASAANAAHTAIFCSTIPEFGFGPLADDARIAETREALTCRPCGLHGKKACPLRHFKCASTISATQVFNGVEYYRAIAGNTKPEQMPAIAAYFLGKKHAVGIQFEDINCRFTPFENFRQLQSNQFVSDKTSAQYIVVNRITTLKYFTQQLPDDLFEWLDKHASEDVLLHLPSINPPNDALENSLQLPVYLTHNSLVGEILAKAQGALLMNVMKNNFINNNQLANSIEFYWPASSELALNKAHIIRVDNEGKVVAK